MVRKKGEQGGATGGQERTVENMCEKSLLSIPIPAEFNASDGEEWFHFQGNSLPS